LAATAGASYVARSTVYHVRELESYVAQAVSKEGFALVEAVSYCHTTLGRLNRWGTAADMMQQIKEQSITKRQAEGLTTDELEGKIVRGVFAERDIPEYTQEYEQIIAQARREAS
jgi:2-oxoglutarate ferredoxin oxidoreductase subunit beta